MAGDRVPAAASTHCMPLSFNDLPIFRPYWLMPAECWHGLFCEAVGLWSLTRVSASIGGLAGV
jgi:hypothetical protein